MIKPIRRSVARASSLSILRRRIVYIEDRNVEEHKDLVIYPAVNYNCGPKAKDFEAACLKADELYQKAPARRRGGKASTRIFEEFVYSTPEGAHLNELERKTTESTLVNNFSRHAAARLAWHSNEQTGRSDLHVLIASKNDDWPPGLTLWSEYGGSGKKCILSVINRVSNDIVKKLNIVRPANKKLKSAQQVHKERLRLISGKKSHNLAEELAALDFAPAELKSVIESLGYEVTRDNDTNISVKFPENKRAHRYNKTELFRDITEISSEHEEPTGPGGREEATEPAEPKITPAIKSAIKPVKLIETLPKMSKKKQKESPPPPL